MADDGRGFVPAAADGGYGLRGMRERLELVGGSARRGLRPGPGHPADGSGSRNDRSGYSCVDDQRLVRDGIASLLGIEPELEVVGTAADGPAALELAAVAAGRRTHGRPNAHNGRSGGDRGAAAALPDCRVLMLTTFDDEEYVVRALRAGASGYLLKDVPAADLAQAIRLAHAGVDQHDPAAIARLVGALDRAERRGRDPAPGRRG